MTMQSLIILSSKNWKREGSRRKKFGRVGRVCEPHGRLPGNLPLILLIKCDCDLINEFKVIETVHRDCWNPFWKFTMATEHVTKSSHPSQGLGAGGICHPYFMHTVWSRTAYTAWTSSHCPCPFHQNSRPFCVQ